jgi:hypothetical protein
LKKRNKKLLLLGGAGGSGAGYGGRVVLFLAPLLFTGCSSLLTQSAGAGAGVGAAAVSNALTTNGAVTAGIGLGTQAAAVAGVQYLEKRVHAAEQNAIAAAGGETPVGGVTPWRIVHQIPIEGDEHGEVSVTSYLTPNLPSGTAPAFDCKEIIFSVDTMAHKTLQQSFYTADICRDGATWKWATAEPATERWGSLQ